MPASSNSIILWAGGVTVAWVLWRAANLKRIAVIPRPDQIMALFERAPAGKIHMLNLIKFRAAALYEDGRASTLTGAQAYDLYDASNRTLIGKHGGRVIFSGDANTLVIGPGAQPEFDRVVLFEFPSMEAYNDIAGSSVELQKENGFQDHQFAGIAFQQLIHCNSTTEEPGEDAD